MSILVRGMLAAAAVLWTANLALSAEPPKDAPREAAGGVRAVAADGSVDSILVMCLIKENENEIAVARYAVKQAKDKDVQAFAERMVKDHTAFLTKLQKLEATLVKNRDKGDAARDTKGDNRDAHAAKFATMMVIGNELSQKCLATTLRELGQKEGSEFDHCYMGGQIFAHLKMADTMDVYKRHSGSELRELLTAGAETTHEHLTMAKKTMRDLDSAGNKTTSK